MLELIRIIDMYLIKNEAQMNKFKKQYPLILNKVLFQ